jgi:hypothetical protein
VPRCRTNYQLESRSVRHPAWRDVRNNQLLPGLLPKGLSERPVGPLPVFDAGVTDSWFDFLHSPWPYVGGGLIAVLFASLATVSLWRFVVAKRELTP